MAAMNVPNNTSKDARENSTAPLGRGASPINPPNTGLGGDRRGGTADLAGQAPTVTAPNTRTVPIGHSSQG